MAASLSSLYQATLGTCVAAMALGVVYGSVLAWVPHAYLLTPLAAAGFGYLVALVAERMLVASRVAQRGARLGLPLFAGTLGFYVAWVAWVATVYHTRDAFILVWSPPSLFTTLQILAYYPTWQLLGWDPKVHDLWSLWGCELLVYFLTVHACATGAVQRYDRGRTPRG